MHKVLERQIRKTLGIVNISSFPQPWRELLEAISNTYTHYDEDHTLLEHSLEISSKANKTGELITSLTQALDGNYTAGKFTKILVKFIQDDGGEYLDMAYFFDSKEE